MALLLFMYFPSVSGRAVQDAALRADGSGALEFVDSTLRAAVPEFPRVSTADPMEWLRETQRRGFLADITGGLNGRTIKVDYPGRPHGESLMRLLPASELINCTDPIKPYRRILGGDIILFYKADGSLMHSGIAVQQGDTLRILCPGRGLSQCSLAAYCSRWRSVAGIKVLRVIWNARPYNYTKRECMVPMRDGCRLYTAVYEPVGAGKKPILMVRNCYSLSPYGCGGPGNLSEKLRCFTDRGYIIVEQNVRGTYMSEGEYENLRPLRSGEQLTDEATDTYDTIDWLLANTRSNGRVGIYGVSYPGFYATMAALCGHPALKLVSPQAPVTDWWKGDDAHHNGALMLADMYGFGGFFFQPKGNPAPEDPDPVVSVPEGADLYGYFRGRSMRSVFRSFGDSLEFFKRIKEHPDYDSFWQERNPLRHLQGKLPAMMVVGGWYDAEDGYGPLATYKAAVNAANEPSGEQPTPVRPAGHKDIYLVSGPWTHGGWRDVPHYLEDIEMPVFEYYLEGKGSKPRWHRLFIPTGAENPADLFDPAESDARIYRLKPGSYVSDPANPVPYMDVKGAWREKAYMWAPQNFLEGRSNVLSQVIRKPLKDSLLAIGPVRVHLKAKVSCHPERSEGSLDADFIVKLIDVAPDGTQRLVRWEVMPARWRNSYEKAEPLVPGKPFEVDFTMNDICHLFAPGHSIMVQVQSSMFPVVAMNPQTFLSNPYTAPSTAYKPLKISIMRGSNISF